MTVSRRLAVMTAFSAPPPSLEVAAAAVETRATGVASAVLSRVSTAESPFPHAASVRAAVKAMLVLAQTLITPSK